MKTENYFIPFDVAERKASDIVLSMVNERLDVRLASDGSFLDSVVSSDCGYVEAKAYSLPELTEIYFEHSSGSRLYQKLYKSVEIGETKQQTARFIVIDEVEKKPRIFGKES